MVSEFLQILSDNPLLFFLAGEIIAIPFFRLLRRFLKLEKLHWREFSVEAIKGLVERFFITTSLLMGFPQSLILFGALKLGNRLSHEKSADPEASPDEDKITNYFLLGNLLSILICFGYVWFIRGCTEWTCAL